MEFVTKEPINKGWSGDKKYLVITRDSEKYLFRTTPKEKADGCRQMFEYQSEAAKRAPAVCRPVEFGLCDEGAFTLQHYVNGNDAEAVIPTLTADEQYSLGIDAGKALLAIHSIPAPADIPDWEVRFNNKIDRKIRMYADCTIKFDGAEKMIDYIGANRHLLSGRPQCFQHGDYHIGNMMVEDGRLVIIDFDQFGFGDPWEEFNRIVWSAQAAPDFASGIVDGYFGGKVPTDFWRLTALYICSNSLSSVPWAIPFGDTEISTMLNQVKDVLDWYDNMKTPIPSWYHKR